MCDVCDIDFKPILKTDVVSRQSWGWGGDTEISGSEAATYPVGVLIDARCDTHYLRLVDLEDCQCLEGGEKVEIHFCPKCGRKLNSAQQAQAKI